MLSVNIALVYGTSARGVLTRSRTDLGAFDE